MRTAVAAAVLAATSLVGLGATPAHASGCAATVSGWDISSLELKGGVTCDHAKQVIHHVFNVRHGPRAINWDCNDPLGTSWKLYSCWALNHSGHSITFTAHERGAPGGF